ncbi:hypothetical protein LMJ43_36735, partial [Streptomyces rochei]|nr:hypothetical protein [Streptomyces rochei]
MAASERAAAQTPITSRFSREHHPRPARFPSMRKTSNIIFAAVLIAASGAAIAQAPPAPATPPQATAPPSPQRAAGCALRG